MKLTFKKVHTSPPHSIAYILQDEKEPGFNFMVYTTDKVEAIVKLKKWRLNN